MEQTLTVSHFTCDCERRQGVNYACSNALNWIAMLTKSDDIDFARMKSLYSNILLCNELNEYEEQINKDLSRTFPKCPQFKNYEGQ